MNYNMAFKGKQGGALAAIKSRYLGMPPWLFKIYTEVYYEHTETDFTVFYSMHGGILLRQ